MKTTTKQNINANDSKKIPSPNKMRRAPDIIGFLMCQYNPEITNSFGGTKGQGLPLPEKTNNP
jgi:hypothetical protein